MPKRKIVWTRRATQQLTLIVDFISLQSNQSADNFHEIILTKVNKLSDGTHVHRIDPLKRKNDGNYLYFEILKLRISYYATPNEVVIVRVRHTKQKPAKY